MVAEPGADGSTPTRGEVWWADLPDERGSEPAGRRPVLVVQSDAFNRSRLRTVVVVALTSNTDLADAPGNVLLSSRLTGLPRDSTANVAHVVTVDRRFLVSRARGLSPSLMSRV